MKATPGGIWYAEDGDARAYAEQVQATVTSAETAFDEVNAATTAYINARAATVTIPTSATLGGTDTFQNLFMGTATITQYGGTFLQLSAFNQLQFMVDGWFHINFGAIFTESVAPAVNSSRGAGFQHIRNSTFPGVINFYAQRNYTSSLNPQISTACTCNQLIGVHAGDFVQTMVEAKISSGTVTATGRMGILYVGPLVYSA